MRADSVCATLTRTAPAESPAHHARRWALGALLLAGAACAPTPPPAAAPVTLEDRMSQILRLEDHRILRDPQTSVPPAAAGAAPAAVAGPDLIRLLGHDTARIRRRAALAVGRIGLAEGIAPLIALLADPEQEVRQMAAFGLGLIGDPAAVEALTAALADPVPVVQGRAAEALGLIGAADAAPAIGEMVARHLANPVVFGIAADEMGYPLDPAVEAFRLGLYALARLKAYDPLAGALLASDGLPRLHWWPVAYAFQRVGDERSAPVLRTLAQAGGYTAAFAARGLGELQDASAVPQLSELASRAETPPFLVAAAVRALGDIGDPAAVPALMQVAVDPARSPEIRLEAVTALGRTGSEAPLDVFLDYLSDRWPAMRAAALQAIPRISPQMFVTVLSGMDPDPHWSVRAALAQALGSLESAAGVPRLRQMLDDSDQRVIPAVLLAFARLKAPDALQVLESHLAHADPVIRMAAIRGLAELKPENLVPLLTAAYEKGLGDPTYVARGAALAGLADLGAQPAVVALLERALEDPSWAVRVRALMLLESLDVPGEHEARARPAPSRFSAAAYEDPTLVDPQVSPHVYLDTAKGTVEIELAVLDAPLTAQNFMTLARAGFFNGVPFHRVIPNFVVQGGDPRGDGEGGPGHTIRDELNQLPYLRGTVGMALDWRDTGGSQFFITRTPQPHLDARYTAFGRVVDGIDVVDQLQQWDVIERVRVWDGTTMSGVP